MTSSRGRPPVAAKGAPRPPRVAILGRPNVGKSSLFNALLGRRRSITHRAPGVTRDPVEAECMFGGTRLVLVDTGGYTRGTETAIDGLVAGRSIAAAREADLALLVLDGMESTPEDADFMERLRPLSDKLVVVVNKIDTPDRDAFAWNAYAHGFPNVVGVSAAHARNLDQLRDLVSALLEARPRSEDQPGGEGSGTQWSRPVRIAVLGKPNTGKSSLANRVIGEERSIVSPVPGTTRDVVEGRFVHRGRTCEILDTAGIRRKSRVTDPVEYYSVNRALESIRNADLVFLLLDATEGLADQDKKIAAQAAKEGRGIVLVLNKWDLLAKKPRLLSEVTARVRFQFPVLGFAPLVPVSARTGYGVQRLLDTALQVEDQLQRRVGTGRVNHALETWVSHYPLPVRGKNFKIRFATQVGANPVRFVVFVNRLAGFPVAYTQYLENCIRRDLGFSLVPVLVELRQSKKKPR